LRFVDNEVVCCSQFRLAFIGLFFEPSVMNYDDADVRHWRFVYESIQDLQKKLNPINATIYFFS
jgi:deoxyribodipyrimidine photo-lyase